MLGEGTKRYSFFYFVTLLLVGVFACTVQPVTKETENWNASRESCEQTLIRKSIAYLYIKGAEKDLHYQENGKKKIPLIRTKIEFSSKILKADTLTLFFEYSIGKNSFYHKKCKEKGMVVFILPDVNPYLVCNGDEFWENEFHLPGFKDFYQENPNFQSDMESAAEEYLNFLKTVGYHFRISDRKRNLEIILQSAESCDWAKEAVRQLKMECALKLDDRIEQ